MATFTNIVSGSTAAEIDLMGPISENNTTCSSIWEARITANEGDTITLLFTDPLPAVYFGLEISLRDNGAAYVTIPNTGTTFVWSGVSGPTSFRVQEDNTGTLGEMIRINLLITNDTTGDSDTASFIRTSLEGIC